MITKLSTFRGISQAGDPLVRLFRPGDSITKVAGDFLPDVQDWLSTYKSDKQKVALLINALGASEYWGQNINGDIFPWDALAHDCRNHPSQQHMVSPVTGKELPPYGYWTFLQAKPFAHHRNKDPNRAFGDVVLSCLHPKMRRVELVVLLDRALALQNGGQSIIDRIDAGEFPDCSMGCRVPYDTCQICGNNSRTRADYCSCVKNIGMGKILEDGRQIGVINWHPRFFDISFVFIGADKTAKVMAKLGSATALSADEGAAMYGDDQRDSPCSRGHGHCCHCSGKCKVAVTTQTNTDFPEDPYLKARPPVEKSESEMRMERLEAGTHVPTKHYALSAHKSNGEGQAVLQRLAPEPVREAIIDVGTPYDQSKIAALMKASEKVVGKHRDTPDSKFDPKELEMGMKVEREHIDDPALTKEIAKDHLAEIPDYYTRLKKMEEAGKKKEAQDFIETAVKGIRKLPWHLSDDVAAAIMKAEQAVPAKAKPKEKKSDIIKTSAFNIEPPPTPNRKEYPYKGTIQWKGLKIMVENLPGDTREGISPQGKKWATKMKLPYGEILGVKGTDKDRLDVYIGPNDKSDQVFIVHQNRVGGAEDGMYDEDKVMIGFDNSDDAKKAYLEHYDSPEFFRSITSMAFDQFKDAIKQDSGEKIAGLQKIAMDLKLEDLFAGAGNARRRERTWRDKTTGEETNVTGSGMGSSFENVKTASVKRATVKRATLKEADIDKEVEPSRAVGKVAPLLSERETDFPREVLNELGIKNLEGALATPSALGMMLKPHEFQRIMLVNTGHGDAADMMDRDRLVFRPSSGMMQPCQSLGADHIIEDLLRAIMPFLESRSYLEPVVKRRIIRIRIIKPVEQKFELADNLPLLSKISAAYNWYRDEAVKMATMAPQIISSRPDIQAAVLGLTDHDIFTKQAISPEAASIIGAVPLSLMGSAHYRGEMEQGKPVGMVGRVMAEHPGMSAVGSALMARQLARTNIGKNLIEGVLDTGRQLIGPKA